MYTLFVTVRCVINQPRPLQAAARSDGAQEQIQNAGYFSETTVESTSYDES